MNPSSDLSHTRLAIRRLPAVLLGCIFLALTACGQRGPLYLPDEAAQPEPPAQQAREENEEENDEETS